MQHRNAQERPKPTKPLCFPVFILRIRVDVRDVYGLPFNDGPACRGSPGRAYRVCLVELDDFGCGSDVDEVSKDVAVPEVYVALVGPTQMDGVVDDCLERRSEIGGVIHYRSQHASETLSLCEQSRFGVSHDATLSDGVVPFHRKGRMALSNKPRLLHDQPQRTRRRTRAPGDFPAESRL